MWIFSKAFKGTVDKIIVNELQTRRQELDLSVAKLNSEYDFYKKSYEDKLSGLGSLKLKVESELLKLERVRNKAEEEQKRLWDRLDILRDNLNTEDVWIKLWECAYSKAVDSVWIILQKEMAHMVSLAEERSYVRAKAEFDDDLNKRVEGLKSLANTKTDIPVLKILALKKDIEDKMLIAERVKNVAQVSKYMAQLEILGGLL